MLFTAEQIKLVHKWGSVSTSDRKRLQEKVHNTVITFPESFDEYIYLPLIKWKGCIIAY